LHFKSFGVIIEELVAGLSREILQGRTRLLWGPGDRLRLLSKLGILIPIKLLVTFHIKCFISCASESPNNNQNSEV